MTTLLQLPFFFWLQIAIRAKLGKVDRVQFFKENPPDWGCHSEPPQAGWARLTTFNLSQRKQPPYLTGVAIQSPLSLARDLASCWSAHSTASTPASCATTWKRPTLEGFKPPITEVWTRSRRCRGGFSVESWITFTLLTPEPSQTPPCVATATFCGPSAPIPPKFWPTVRGRASQTSGFNTPGSHLPTLLWGATRHRHSRWACSAQWWELCGFVPNVP